MCYKREMRSDITTYRSNKNGNIFSCLYNLNTTVCIGKVNYILVHAILVSKANNSNCNNNRNNRNNKE